MSGKVKKGEKTHIQRCPACGSENMDHKHSLAMEHGHSTASIDMVI